MANEIKFYLSGGASNANPFASNGGAISSTEIINGLLNNLWPDVSEADTNAGMTDHKVIYIKNVSGAALTQMRAYFGEADQYVGMQITASTVVNTAAPALAAATDTITQYYLVWANIAETSPATVTVNLDNKNKRVVMYIGDTRHPIYNQFPDQIELMIKKTGAPTGTATIKVWTGANTATDNTVVRTIGTLDVSTLTTTLTKYKFNTVTDLITNPLPSIAWRVGIEFTGGTATAHVDVGVTTQTTANNLDSWVETWDGSKWVDTLTQWLAMNFYNNPGPCFQGGTLPPPGSGSPPPGTNDCGATPLASGTAPAVGGGGGAAAATGYDITAVSDNGNDGNVAANVKDHNLATRWSQNSTNAQLTLDLGATKSVSSVKIAWYKGDQRTAKFDLQHSTDGTNWTNLVGNAGAHWNSSGHSTQLEQFSFAVAAGQSAADLGGGAVAVTTTLWFQTAMTTTGDNPEATTAAEWASDGVANEGIEAITDPFIGIDNNINQDQTQDGWTATDQPASEGDGEICDVCEWNDKAAAATFSDGLAVPYYWNIKTNKCAAPGAASEVSVGKTYNMTNKGASVMPNPIIWLIFWGTTWNGTNNQKRKDVVDLVQNKLLGSDNVWWSTAMDDYGFNIPKWGGYVVYTGSLPANTAAYKTNELDAATLDAITKRPAIVSDPTSSTFVSNNVRCSNIIYICFPDPSWRLQSSEAGFVAYHTGAVGSFSTADPNPPPSSPPTDPPSPPAQPPPVPIPPTTTPGPAGAINARYIRYTGLGNSTDNWNSITEFEIWGSGASTCQNPTGPPGGGQCVAGTNPSKPTSFATGLCVPDLNNNDYCAITLERVIPPNTGHTEVDNYSIVISNDANVQPPSDEPIPQTPGGDFGGQTPVPTPPGAFDPGTLPPLGTLENPPPVDNTPPPPDGGGPAPDPGGGGLSGSTTPDGIKLVALPSGYSYSDQHTNFKTNFQSNGSYRLDCGVQPQLNELNLTFALNLSSGSDEISSKLSGGTHTDSKAKNGRCYDIGLNQAGDRCRIRKEDPHPSYHDATSHSIHLGSLNGKWVYVQSLKWNEGSNCHLQCWVDTSGNDTPSNNFVKVLDDIDTGSWFEAPYLTCYDSSDSQTTIRVDNMSTSKFHYKFMCATRIKHG